MSHDMTLSQQGQATMTSLEIAELVESRHDAVKRTIERLAKKEVVQLPPTVEVKNHLGQTVSVYSFSGEQGKRDSYVVVAQLSPEFTARLVDRWQDLENGHAKPITNQQPSVAELVQAADVMASALRLEGTARVTALRSFSVANCPQLLPMMPDYAIDAPTVAGGAASSLPTASASDLLKKHGAGVSAAFFNKVCHSQGLLEKRSRTNSKGKEVSFWCLTHLGLEYGKNVTSPQSPRQTAPHWYEERFSDLLTVLGFDKAA